MEVVQINIGLIKAVLDFVIFILSGWIIVPLIQKTIFGHDKNESKTGHVFNAIISFLIVVCICINYNFVIKGLLVSFAVCLCAFFFYSIRQCYIPDSPDTTAKDAGHDKQTDCLAIKSCILCERNNKKANSNDICDCKNYKILTCFIEQHNELLKNIHQK